jgi:tRNA dimethylallyltransferase
VGGGAHRSGLSAATKGKEASSASHIVVAGPTASGKSGLALAIAREFGGRIVNADSMQVYRELAILTARPQAGELAAAPHRLYGVLPASERCSAGQWREMALTAMGETPAALPIVAGGTGLYLRALERGLSPIPRVSEIVQREAEARSRECGAAGLHAELQTFDPAMAQRLAPGDTQRILRAWSVHRATGRPLSDWQSDPGDGGVGPCLKFVLMPPRDQLYAAIDARFRRMVKTGAVEEVRSVLALGLDPSLPAMKAVGLRELGRMLAGEVSLEDAIAAAQQATRRYAKRQITWLRHQIGQAEWIGEQFSERVLPDIFTKIRHFLLTDT